MTHGLNELVWPHAVAVVDDRQTLGEPGGKRTSIFGGMSSDAVVNDVREG